MGAPVAEVVHDTGGSGRFIGKNDRTGQGAEKNSSSKRGFSASCDGGCKRVGPEGKKTARRSGIPSSMTKRGEENRS